MLLGRELAEDEAVVTHLRGRGRALPAQKPFSPSGIIQCLCSALPDDKSRLPTRTLRTQEMEVLPSAANTAPDPKPVTPSLLSAKGPLSAHSGLYQSVSWNKEEAVFKSVYLYTATSHSPRRGGNAACPRAAFRCALPHGCCLLAFWESGEQPAPAQQSTSGWVIACAAASQS